MTSIPPSISIARQNLLACPHARAAAIKSQQTRLERFEKMPNRTPQEINVRQAFLDLIISTHKRMSGETLN